MLKACHKTCHERLGSRINTSFACGFKSHRRHKNGNPRICAGSPFFVVLCGFAGGASLHGCLQKCTDFCIFDIKACHETCHDFSKKNDSGSQPSRVFVMTCIYMPRHATTSLIRSTSKSDCFFLSSARVSKYTLRMTWSVFQPPVSRMYASGTPMA